MSSTPAATSDSQGSSCRWRTTSMSASLPSARRAGFLLDAEGPGRIDGDHVHDRLGGKILAVHRAVDVPGKPHLLQEVHGSGGGGIGADGHVDSRLQHLLHLAGDVEHEDVGGGAPRHVRARRADLLDVLVRESDAVDQHRMVVEAAQLLQDLDAPLGLLVESLLQVRDEGKVVLDRARVLYLESRPPTSDRRRSIRARGCSC